MHFASLRSPLELFDNTEHNNLRIRNGLKARRIV